MMKFFIIFSFFLSLYAFTEESECGDYLSENLLIKGKCESVNIDASDKASLQRGAKLYMNYCFGCHSLKYVRYNRISKDLSIPQDLFEKNLIFGNQKMGDLMTNGMNPSDAKDWFGIAPPDLTLQTSLKGPDWLYTYLISFYIDETRPLGVNNKVYENVSMPNILVNLQGNQHTVCKDIPEIAENGGQKQDPLTGNIITYQECGFLEVEEGSGELSSESFNSSMQDLTNFLSYVSDPIKLEREYMGKFVILYLLIFTVLAYLLYREFKKDIH